MRLQVRFLLQILVNLFAIVKFLCIENSQTKVKKSESSSDFVKCKCGAKMQKMIASSAYGGADVGGDNCEKLVQGHCYIYHCPTEKNSPSHPQGYDICENCAQKEEKEQENAVCVANND